MTDRSVRNQLLAFLDQAFDHRSWHGTNLRGSIRRVTHQAAAWRPGKDRHNIWELTVHAAYWKYAVRRRLTGEKRGSFPLAGSNFWRRPIENTDAAWRADVELLLRQHAALRTVVAGFPDARLAAGASGSTFTCADLIRGAAAHDLYHAGQIQLLKRLAAHELGECRPESRAAGRTPPGQSIRIVSPWRG